MRSPALTGMLLFVHNLSDSTILRRNAQQIGVIVVDTCSSRLRTVANLFELFAAQNSLLAPTPQDLVRVELLQCLQSTTQIGVIHSSYEADASVTALLTSFGVPIMNIDSTPDALASSSLLMMGAAATDALHARAIVATSARMNWTFVNLVYESSHW